MNASRRIFFLGTTLFGSTICFSLPLFAATVQGKVIGPDKVPIVGATVLIMANGESGTKRLQSGDDGTWTAEIPNLKPVEDANLAEAQKEMARQFIGMAVVVAPGKALAQNPLFKDKSNEIQLMPSVTVGGIVQDANGAPIVGTTVRLQGFNVGESGRNRVYFYDELERLLLDNISTQTDATGHWQLDGVLPNSQVQIKLVDDRFGRIVINAEAGQKNAVIKAVAPASIIGRLLYPDGKPASGMKVMGNDSRNNKSDDEGRFAIKGLAPEQTWYQISDPKGEWMVAEKYIEKLEAGQIYDLGDIKLTKGVTLKGKLVDEDGKPIEDANISASNSSASRTKADGSFELRAIPGQSWVWVNKDGFLPLNSAARQIQIEAGEAEQTLPPITLKRGVYLMGVALDAEGKPATDAVIMSGRRYDEATAEASVGPDGTFRLGPLVPGKEITLSTTDEWDLTTAVKLTVPSLRMAVNSPKLNLTLKKVKPLDVAGRVVAPDGKPLAGVNVRVTVFLDAEMNSRQYRDVASDADGKITVGGLRPEQTPKVESVLSDDVVFVKAPKAVRNGERWDLGDIVSSPLDGELKGVVLDAESKPVGGAKLAVVGKFGPTIISSGNDGRFVLNKMARGEVTLLAAKDHSFARLTATTGQDVQVRLENRPTPTQAEGVQMLTGKVGGHSGYIVATAVPLISPEEVLAIIKRSGDNKPDPTAMGVVLDAFANRDPKVAATWGIEQWQRIQGPGLDNRVAFTTGTALARAAFATNPKFTANWFEAERAKLPANDFSAEAADKYFALAGIAALLKRPEATTLVDMGLTAADRSVRGETRNEKLEGWGESIANSPQLLESLAQDMEPGEKVKVWASAVKQMARVDTEAAGKLLDQLVQLCKSPDVKAADAKIVASRESGTIWHPLSTDTLGEARQAYAVALATKPGDAALQMVQQVSEDYRQAGPLLQIARRYLAAGRQAEALTALKALPANDADTLARSAALALPLDKALAQQLFQKAAQQLFNNERHWGDNYRPSGAAYSLFYANIDPAEARLRLENEWAWRLNLHEDNSSEGRRDSSMREIAIAMATLDMPRGLEMLDSLKKNAQQNEFALTYIGLYLATNGQTDPVNPWQDNQF